MDERNDATAREENPLPLVAPCHALEPRAPLRWLGEGWRDLRRAPFVSLSLGLGIVAVSWAIS